MIRLICAAALALLMSGCTVAQSVNYGVVRYCALPPEVRGWRRALVTAAVAPNRIVVECF